MPRLDENDAATLILRFSNGSGLSLSFDRRDMEDPSENTQSLEVAGDVENQDDGFCFLVGESVECGFNSTIISRLVNVRSVAELVRVVSGMYYISDRDEIDLLLDDSPNCGNDDSPKCENNDVKIFEPYDVTMDLAGTMYQGRPDRIEQLKIGEEVCFVREPDNLYAANVIDVMSDQGSLGYVHGEIAEFLAPLMDQGILQITAKVEAMTTRKQRSARAKKPLLDISCVYTLQKDGEEKQFAKLTDLYKALHPEKFKLADHSMSVLNDATQAERVISNSIEKAIRENMKTMDDLEEVFLATGSFAAYYREPEMCTLDYIISRPFGFETYLEIKKVYNEVVNDNMSNFIDGLKRCDIFKNVNKESLAKIAYLYEEDALKDVNDYGVKQTWKKGREINIDFVFFEITAFGLFGIWDIEDLGDEDGDMISRLDSMMTVEVKHEIPYIRWAK